jgi:pilus assembly protein Flp/PilA
MSSRFPAALEKFLKREAGPTAVEYAVMMTLIIVVCMGAITTLGAKTNGKVASVADSLGSTPSDPNRVAPPIVAPPIGGP